MKKRFIFLGILFILLVFIFLMGYLIPIKMTGNVVNLNSPICEFEVLQDNNFNNGFTETWLTNLPESERCAMPFGDNNPNWDLQENSNHLFFCENLPNPKTVNPILLNSSGNFWEYNESWKIPRTWEENGGLWEYDTYWNSWIWYQKELTTNLGTGWRTVTIKQPKELINYGEGHLRFKIDTSFEENRGCRVNTKEGIVNRTDKLWWSHWSITQTSLGLNIKDYDSLTLNISYKLNNITFKNRCSNNEVYPFWEDYSMHSASAGFTLYFILSNISSVGDKPQSLFLGTPARFVYINNTLNGITGKFELQDLTTGFDTWSTPVYNTPIDSNQLNLLKTGAWVSYSIPLMSLLDNLGQNYDLDLSKYALTSFQLITEPYGVGVYEDFEVKDISLIVQSNNKTLCDTKNSNPLEWFYSPGYKKSLPNIGWQDVNGEQWYNSGNGWVMRPFYYNVTFFNIDEDLICTSFNYSSWTQCDSLALQTRTITSQSPIGCTGGTPQSLTKQCSPPCLLSNWQSTDSLCLESNNLIRNWTKIGNCNQTIGVNKPSSETIDCVYNPNIITCSNFTYSNWSECLSNGIQNRTVLNSTPLNCQNGNPSLTQSCNYTPPLRSMSSQTEHKTVNGNSNTNPEKINQEYISPNTTSPENQQTNTTVIPKENEARSSILILRTSIIGFLVIIIIIGILVFYFLNKKNIEEPPLDISEEEYDPKGNRIME